MTNKKLKTKAASIAIAAALALTGTVPSFADEKTFEGAPEAPDITAESAIIIDAGSGQVLYEKDADVERDPASITKVLNLLVCLDTLDFDAEVTVDRNTDPTESSIKLQKGETIKVSDIAYCMMLKSANDAAEYLGYLAGGDMETFCEMMNEKAASCGAKKTKYINPNGLNPYSVNNITTARDIALVVREAMRDERFRTIVGTRSYTVPATNKSEERKIYNSNRCLWNGDRVSELKALQKEAEENPPTYTVDEITGEKTMDPASAARNKEIRRLKNKTRYMVEGCIGVKTGYTSTAGGCFAGYASRGNTDIIVVVMKTEGRTDRFRESGKLWDYAFDNFESYTAAKSGEVQYSQKVRRGTLRKVDLGIANDLKVTTLKGADPESIAGGKTYGTYKKRNGNGSADRI